MSNEIDELVLKLSELMYEAMDIIKETQDVIPESLADEIEWTKKRLFKLYPSIEQSFIEAFGEDHSIKEP